jgi:thiosulfate dehydrogenase
VCLAVLAMACTPPAPAPERRTAVEHGRDLFRDPRASTSRTNVFSCATCHRALPTDAPGEILPGADLGGVIERPTYWGGADDELLRAINHCRTVFMGAQKPWSRADEPARAMYAYLDSLAPHFSPSVSFTVVPAVTDLPAGDPAAGADLHRRACRSCHGEIHTGAGRLAKRIPALPDEAVAGAQKAGYSRQHTRVMFIEKARHGAFLGLYGNMPPFSTERVSDAELAGLVVHYGL